MKNTTDRNKFSVGEKAIKDTFHITIANGSDIEQNYDFFKAGISPLPYYCPTDYELNPDNTSECIKEVAATYPVTPIPLAQTDTNAAAMVRSGAIIYEDISDKQFPILLVPQDALGSATTNTIISPTGDNYSSIVPPNAALDHHGLLDTPTYDIPVVWNHPDPNSACGVGIRQSDFQQGAFYDSLISGGVLYLAGGNVIQPTNFVSSEPYHSDISCSDATNWYAQCHIWSSPNGLASLNQWYGFTRCIDIAFTKTYYIAIAANNAFRIRLNNELIIECNQGDGIKIPTAFVNIFPITLNAGTNILQLEALNYSLQGGIGCEIYNCTLAELLAVSTYAGFAPYTIFSTKDSVGSIFDISTNPANSYTCPVGYTFAVCEGAPMCLSIVDALSPTDVEMMTYITGNPTSIQGMIVRSDNEDQLDKPIEIIKKVMSNSMLKKEYFLTKSEFQTLPNQISYNFAKEFSEPFVVDGSEIIRFTVLPHTEVKLIFEFTQVRLKDLLFFKYYFEKYKTHYDLKYIGSEGKFDLDVKVNNDEY